MKQLITILYGKWLTLLEQLKHVFLLAIRLYWGFGFMQTGWGKYQNWDRTVGFFTSLHIPFPALNVGMASTTEFLGGLCLLLGFKSRITTVPLIFTMLVAYGTAHQEEVKNIFISPDAFLTAPPFLFLWTALTVLLFGAGKWSIDRA